MNEGDNTVFTNSTLGSVGGGLSFSADADGFIMSQTINGDVSGMTLTYANNELLVSEIFDSGTGDVIFNNPLMLLNETLLEKYGSMSSSSTGTVSAGGASGSASVTLLVTTAKAGTVTVPAGSYTNCISLTLALTVTANGTTQKSPLNAFILAPGAGVIEQALYSSTGTTAAQEGWSYLTSGTVGGAPVASLAPLSGLTMPVFTLEPKSTTATNNGSAILRATASGGELQYQWQFNGSNLTDGGGISGSTSSNLVINPVLFANAGVYSVTITNLVCGVVSTDAVLTVVPDTTPPVVSITNMPAGLTVSNAAFTIMGAASDNIAVSNVLYSVNGTGWTEASSSTTNWSRWTAAATLAPGTNTILAQAVDTSGNLSKVATNTVDYIVSAVLTVQTNQPGWGVISQNHNGALLAIGTTYTLTATAASGFAFSDWSSAGITVTNGKTLVFTMVTNLALTANFADITKPTLGITNMPAGLAVSNAGFTVAGTARDNVAVSNVLYAVNGTNWTSAVSANHWSNWTGQVTLNAGTNAVTAYAVDTSGNVSLIVTNPVRYVVSAELTVQTNQPGRGVISQNGNGSLLALGTTYQVTATAGAGFAFSNWTSAGLTLTNGRTLTFIMVTNLVLTANFADITKPTLSITNMPASLAVSNAGFTVAGTARDNVAVSNVLYAVNGTNWTSAVSANHWSNWTGQVTLSAGTNTVTAYAVDTSGNFSLVASNKATYVVSAMLTVQLTGSGTVSPNDNGALLQVGKNYSLTASPTTGCVFSNWTGAGISPTNGRTLTFMMTSNLIFDATFGDVTPPTVKITSPTANEQVTTNSFVIRGTASDNVAVSNVWYQFNGGGWLNPTGTSNWTAAVTLNPGTNTVMAHAVDTSGNVSATNTVNFVYVSKSALTVEITGQGTVSQNYNGQSLAIGENYSMTAKAATGFAFTNWSSLQVDLVETYLTNHPTLIFPMSSGLILEANFADIAPPTVVITAPTANLEVSNSTYTVTGTAKDNVAVSSVYFSVNGSAWAAASSTNNWTNWTAAVTLTPGTNLLAAYAVDSSGNVSALASNRLDDWFVPGGAWNVVRLATPALITWDATNGLLGGDDYSATNGTLMLNSDGTLSGELGAPFTGGYVMEGSGQVAAEIVTATSTNDFDLFINASQDTMTLADTDTNGNQQELLIFERAPAASTFSALAGTWNGLLCWTPALTTWNATNGLAGGSPFMATNETLTLNGNGTFSTTFAGQTTTGSYTLGSNGLINLIVSPNGRTNRSTWWVNAGQDTLTGISSTLNATNNQQLLQLFERAPSSVTKANLAGVWNVTTFTTPYYLALEMDSQLLGGTSFGVNRGTMTLDASGNINGTGNGTFSGTYALGNNGVVTASLISDGATNKYTLYLNAGKDTMTTTDAKLSASDNAQEIIVFQRAP